MSLRVRLTLWYVAALGACTIVFAAAVYAVARHGLYEGLERVAPAELAAATAEVEHELGELLATMAVGLPVTLVVACALGWVVSGRALRPIGRLAQSAGRITADRLAERLPVEHPGDEVGLLALAFNATLARLEDAFAAMARFTADASHELRTPLTAMRAVGEVGLREDTDVDPRDTISSMLEETDRMTRLVEQLLTLARADGERLQLAREPVELGGLARDAADLLVPLAEERGRSIHVDASGDVTVAGDRTVLRQALVNLIDNAIKYGDASVRVAVERRGDEAIVQVADAGPGIPECEHELVFDRFYRVDKSRARELGGTGLGLSIVRWAATAHGGRVELASEPGRGSTFTVVLPATTNTKPEERSR